MSDVENKSPAFTSDEVTGIIKEVFDNIVGYNNYTFSDSTQWNQRCVETLTAELVKLGRPYKYIATSSLLQTGNGAGLNVSTVSFWNKSTDLSFSYRWEGKHMLAIVNVFAVAI